MTYTQLQTANRQLQTANPRRRGSVLILVVAVLVMLVLIGTAYIQAARSDRNTDLVQGDSAFYSPGTGAPGGSPLNLELDRIRQLLKDDLVDDATPTTFLDDHDGAGNNFPVAGLMYTGVPPTWNYNPFSSREPYDYPHAEIDPWLASTAPQFTGPSSLWIRTSFPVAGQKRGNISNVTGKPTIGPDVGAATADEPWIGFTIPGDDPFLAVPDNDRDADGSPYDPTSAPGVNNWNPKTIWLDGNGNGIPDALADDWDDRADADGDGITDSRFVDAAYGTRNGRRYVAAIRIVDLSALLNINVATALTDQTGAYDPATDAPRWLYPSDLDFARFVFTLSNPVDTQAEMLELLRYRLGLTTTPSVRTLWNTTNPSNPDSRFYFWLNGPALYANFNSDTVLLTSKYRPLGVAEELKLRLRNGLNSPKRLGTALDAVTDPGAGPVSFAAFLRDIDPGDSRPADMYDADVTYDDAYIYGPSSLNGTSGYDYRQILGDYGSATIAQRIAAYFAFEPRHQMTTLSGASIFAPDFPTGGANFLQQDLNIAASGTIATVIGDVYTKNSPTTFPGALPDVGTFANQFTACLADYLDSDGGNADNKLTEYGGRYGFEALPFITEAFVQYDYQVTLATPAGPPSTWDVEWTKRGTGFALEIRNPFDYTIDLRDIKLTIGSVDNDGDGLYDEDPVDGGVDNDGDGSMDEDDAEGTTQTLTSLGAPDQLNAGEFIIVRLNPVDVDPLDTSANDILALQTGLTPDHDLDWGGPTNPFDGITSVNVELSTRDEDDTIDIVYQRLAVSNVTDNSPTYNQNGYVSTSPDPASPGDWGYKHVSTVGNGNGINMILMADIDFVPDIVNYTNEAEPQLYDPGIDKLGDVVKDPPGPADKIFPTADQIFLRNGLLNSVSELAQIVVLGLGPGSPTYADAFAASSGAFVVGDSLQNVRLNFASADFYDTGGNFLLPHALLLMDRFTTLNPADDDQDNDGDGYNDDDPPATVRDEQFVPGRININTVAGTVIPLIFNDVALDRHLLQRILPIPNEAVRNSVIASLVGYRDLLNTSSVGGLNFVATNNRATGIPGWRTQPGIASLGELETATWFVLSGDGADNKVLPETLLNGTAGADIRIDFTPDNASPDGVTDDREEQLLPLSWLSQVMTVRSDRFVVYGLIRGYNNGVLNAANLAEEIRFIAILDRSGIVDETGQVKVLSIITY